MHPAKSTQYENESATKSDNNELTGPLQAKQGIYTITYFLLNK